MRCVLCLMMGLTLVGPAFVQEPEPEPDSDEPAFQEASGKPRLTLDPGDHVGYISKVLFTPDSAHLITAGMDHTIRIWDLQTGECLRVLRPPGFSHGLHPALSPDGKLLAVNASYVMDNKAVKQVIYLMAVADGRIEKVLDGHPTGIRAMAFTADGRRLASASLGGTLRIVDLTGDQPVQEIKTTVRVKVLALSPDGTRLVESRQGHTAWIRSLVGGKDILLKGGKVPLSHDRAEPVAWSPDGKTIATATDNGIWLWEPDGTLRHHLAAKVAAQAVVFSKDSRQVLATLNGGGLPTAGIFNVQSGKQEVEFIPKGFFPAPKNTVLCALSPDGAWAVTVGDGEGVHDLFLWKTADGTAVTRKLGPSWLTGPDLKAAWNAAGPELKAGWSADGKRITWRYLQSPKLKKAVKIKGLKLKAPKGPHAKQLAFNLDELRFGPPLIGEQFHGAIEKQGPFVLQLSADKHPRMLKNGKPLVLKVSQGKGFAHTLLGKGLVALSRVNHVHLMDLKTQKQIRNYLCSGQVRSVAPSPDGRFLLVLSDDQILHIVDPQRDGVVLSLYVNGQDWVAWTPEGYYAASPGGERLMGWTVNNGIDREAAYHPAARLHASLYRPDVIKRVLVEGSVAQALAAADKARGQASKPVEIAQVLPPDVGITLTPAGPGKVAVDADVRPHGTQPITTLQLLVDDRPFTGEGGSVRLAKPQAGPVKWTWKIELPAGPHEVRVLAGTDASFGSSRGIKRVDAAKAPAARLPNLYVLAVGIDAYPDKYALKGAVNDARNLAKAFQESSARVFGAIEVKELIDKDATRDGIRAGLDWLRRKATPTDVSIFFFAGHGERAQDEFFLLPQDMKEDDLAGTCLSRQEIKKHMQALPGKVVVLLDACHSGAIGLLFEDLSRQLINEDCGVAVMCAARPSQVALEAQGKGFFTQSLVGGLRGKAPQRNGRVFLHHLQSYVIDAVADLSEDRQHPVAVVPPWMPPFALSKPAPRP